MPKKGKSILQGIKNIASKFCPSVSHGSHSEGLFFMGFSSTALVARAGFLKICRYFDYDFNAHSLI